MTVGDGDAQAWVYRRDPTVRVPWDDAVLHTSGGIPYLAPDLQLLFKSRRPRAKDTVDACEVVRHLEPERRARLARLLPAGHQWHQLLRRGVS